MLAREIGYHASIVFVSKQDLFAQNTIHVAYHGRVPVIPESMYAQMFFITENKTELLELLPGLVKKAEETRLPLVIVFPLEAREQEVEEILLSHKYLRIVYRGDIFGEEQFLSQSDLVNTFLRSSLTAGKIAVPQSGIGKTFPVHYKDVVTGILEVAYGAHSSVCFFLFPKHPPTEMAVARVLQKAEPLLRIDFTGQSFTGISVKEHQISSLPHGVYLLDEQYPVEKNLERYFKELLSSFSSAERKRIIPEMEERKRVQKKWGSFLMLLITALVVVPCVVFFMSLAVAMQQLVIAKQALVQGDTSKAQQAAGIAMTMFSFSEAPKLIIEKEAAGIGQKDALIPLFKIVAVGRQAGAMLSAAIDGLDTYKKVFAGKSKVPASDFSLASQRIKQASTIFQKLQAEDTKGMPSVLQDVLKDIGAFDATSNLISGTIDTYPYILGFLGERTYVVLFQNNMELRPGGGFIGSFAITKLQNGVVKEFTFYDAYDADGQMKGHIDPPFGLRRYLPIPHWYLRDSNFNVDYTKGASMSAFFLQQELGQRVDGVIGIDVSFLQKVLEVTGPLFVFEYNETVTSENLYQLTQLHAQKDFFPGSTQKKDFLKALFTALQLHVSSKGSNFTYLAFAKILQEGISQKHVLFAFADPGVQDVFTINGLSSSLWDNRVLDANEIVDFLGINEANVGANKVNYSMRRKLYQTITVDEKGNMQEQVTVRYKNTSKKDDIFGGEYKMFLRVIAPLGAKLAGIVIDDQEQNIIPAVVDAQKYEAKNFRPPIGLEVETVEQDNKTIFGFLVLVPIDSFKTVTLSYLLPAKIPLDAPSFIYKQRLFKQPGTNSDLFTFRFVYPSSFSLFEIPAGIDVRSGAVEFAKPLATDKDITLRFSKR